MANEREAEELLRALIQQQGEQRQTVQVQREAQATARVAAMRTKAQAIDRSHPFYAEKFGIHDELKTRELLEAANQLICQGQGVVLPVQGSLQLDYNERVSGYQQAEGANRVNNPEMASTTYPHRTSGEFHFAGYALLTQPSSTRSKVIYAGFITQPAHAEPAGYVQQSNEFVVTTGETNLTDERIAGIGNLGTAASSAKDSIA
ncbi:MAG: hypothetical protein KGL95_07060, partial [Patescibacteria group bacterium]|nr:hypothetical protein [Patescibacteria group bacterium]